MNNANDFPISLSKRNIYYATNLPFSGKNMGPPLSPWHESFPLSKAHTSVLKKKDYKLIKDKQYYLST